MFKQYNNIRRIAGQVGSFPKGGETIEKQFIEIFIIHNNNIFVDVSFQDDSKLVAPVFKEGD